jgi:lipoate---protein ligase
VSGPRRFTSLTLDSLAENLALDELLLLSAEEGNSGEVLRVWEQRNHAVVLGAGCRVSEDVDVQRCRDDDIPVLRRSSGGGTVLLGPGCLCYSLVLGLDTDAALQGIRSSYAWILARISAALASLSAKIHQAGISDLAIGDRKFSGSAQQRKRAYLLHHGTLLYDFDLARVGRYLRLPARRPEYRASRTHDEFLTKISASAEILTAKLQEAWQATAPATGIPIARVHRLARDKYLTDEWTYRR